MKDSVKARYESGAKARSLMTNIWSHDIVERMKIRRKVLAKDCGLGDIDVGTYPSNPATTVINQPSQLVPILASLGLLAGGVAGGAFLTGGLDKPAVEPVKAAQPVEFDLEILGTEDGIKARVLE